MIEDEFHINEDDIIFVDTDLAGEKSCSVKLPNGKFIVGVDMDKVSCDSELRSILGHEIGHCMTDSFYDVDASAQEKHRCESRAIRWAVLFCVPFDAYLQSISDGVRDVYALSDYFHITVQSAIKVAEFYEARFLEYIKLAKEVIV